jgi:predicted aspartyl protease
MRMPRALPALLLAASIAACAAAPPARVADGCVMKRVAALPLHDARNFMLAPVRLNGRAALFVVDTGAEASTLTPQAAQALHLPSDPDHNNVLLGISGPVRTHNVRVHRMEIGDVIRTDQSFGLGEMPAFPGQRLPVVGLLGTDVLAQYELELDLPDGRMSLYAPHGCAGFTPWPDAVVVPFARTRTGLAFVDAVVDGSTVRALLDTGARTTLLARETAASLGVSAAALADDPPRVGIGIGMGNVDFRQHRFAELGLPGAMERDMPANVAEMRLPGVAMLLGADYLGPRRIWISYATGRLFLR